MKTSDTHAFANPFLVWLLVTFGLGGTIGVGTVWLRHEISATANANRQREAGIATLQRQIDETSTAIEGEQITPVLLRRNAEWQLGLVQAAETQIVRMPEDPAVRLAQRRNLELFADRSATVSLKFVAKN